MPQPEPQTTVGRRGHTASFAYALSIGVLIVAVLLRYVLDRWMGDSLPLVTLFGAVAAAVWIGGYRPAILVGILGYLACEFLFIQPRLAFALRGVGDVIGLSAYVFTCALIVVFGEAARLAQAHANERREVLAVTLHSIGDAVITTDIQGRVAYMNPVAESLTGWTQDDATGQPLDAVFRIVNEDTRTPVENPATKALRQGVVVGLANHTVLIRKDRSECPIDDSAAPIRDDDGRVSGCVLIFRNVAAERTAAIEKSKQLLTARRLASIVESSDDAIIGKSLDGIIQSWNIGAERLFGYSADQAVGRHISLVIPPERIAEEDHIVASLKAGERIDHFETERLRADGSRVLVSLTISPIKDAAGQVVGASKIARDVTRQRQAEADRQMFVTLVESSTDFIGMCDLTGIPFFVNRAGLEMVGLDDIDQARRTPVESFFFPEDQHRVMREFFPMVAQQGRGEIEIRFRHFKTGEARWMAYKVLTLPGSSGQPLAFATVSQDITERKRLEDSLRRLAADLSDADRRKNEFLAMLAHELRNPLAPISNAARALRLAGDASDAQRSASEVVERQIGQLTRLVDDLLDMSRITRGKIELRKERTELGPVVHQAVEAARAQYGSMNQELVVTIPAQALYVDADPARLAQVVGNLLNNACKFTDEGGRITLSVADESGQALIRVRDTGIGIAAGDLPRLFDMFVQVDSSLERSRDGLGIGLTLVKTLAEMHGGTVDVHSDGLGCGSEFVVRLPLSVDIPRVLSTPAITEPAATARRRILIVDDSDDGAESLAMLLEFAGHETHKAYDGLEAIEAARRLRPDAVLLDIGLPRLNGYEACRRMRQEPWGKELVLVALTGWGQEEDRRESRNAGFDAHMVKPVDHDALLQFLARLPSRGNPAPA
jgi:PAS domain S-box-containing protein